MPRPEFNTYAPKDTNDSGWVGGELPVNREKPYFIGAQDAWWIASFSHKYEPVRPYESQHLDTTRTNRQSISPAVTFNHATVFGAEIIKTGVLASVFPYIKEHDQIIDVEPRGSFTPDWRVTATILPELINVNKYQKGMDISRRKAQIFVLRNNDYAVKKIRNREEYVSSRPLIFNPQGLAANPDFSFFNPDNLYTGFPLEEFIMAVPVSPRLADLALSLSTEIVLGISEIQAARYINNHFEMEYLIDKDSFSFFNAHDDGDKFKTLGVLWAHTLMRQYWQSYVGPVEALIKSGLFKDIPEQAAYLYNHFRQQMSSTILIEEYEYRRERLNHELQNLNLELIPPTEQINVQLGYNFMKKSFPRTEVLRAIHAPASFGVKAYYPRSYEHKGLPYIPAGLLAYWVDKRQVVVEPSTNLIDPRQRIEADPGETMIMLGNSVWEEAGSLVSRFNPWRSSNLAWYRANNYHIPEEVVGV